MATQSGTDILVRMLQDIEELKSSGARVSIAIEELQGAARQTRAALEELQQSGRVTRVALEAMHAEVARSSHLFDKMAGGIHGLLDAVGSVEARVDDHENRLKAIEDAKAT